MFDFQVCGFMILRMGFTVLWVFFFFFSKVVGFVLVFSLMVQQVLGFAFLGSGFGF